MTAVELAWAMRLAYPVRGLYPHLADYARWGLILRWRGAGGRLLFRIADRGRARLAWLRRRAGTD